MYGVPLVPGTAAAAGGSPPSLISTGTTTAGPAAGIPAGAAAAAANPGAMMPAIYSAGNAIFITAMSRWLNVSFVAPER